MSDNVYAAPLSTLSDPIDASADQRFYVVSTRKMLVLFFMTLGMYQVYWYAKNWIQYRRATGDELWPIPRAIFAVFFTHSLFHDMASHDVSGEREEWDSRGAATAMVLLLIAGRVLDRLSWKDIGSPTTDILSLLLLIPIGMLLKKVQLEVNARCGDPAGSSNEKFTAANIVWCVIGAVVWLLAMVGLFLPPSA
jgi:hypothetical protein